MKRRTLPKKKHIEKEILRELYLTKKYSTARIAKIFLCSENKVNYWLQKYGIQKRTISEAMYEFKNPLGDPFHIHDPKTFKEAMLFGLGIGLYWGEGSKRGNGGVRLTNTDPKLLKKFIEFLEKICGIDKNQLRFSIQIFNDISPDAAFYYWTKELKVQRKQFYKIVVSKVRGEGSYKYKSEYGVIIIYFNNIKLKRTILDMIEKIE